MIKTSRIIDTPVVSRSDQSKLGQVSGIIFDPRERRLTGLLIRRGLFRRARVLPVEEIPAAVERILIDDKKSLVKKKNPRYRELLASPLELIGTQVKEKEEPDNSIGRVREASFYLKDGSLAELEVGKGLLSGITGGRQIILADQIVSIEPGLIIVDLTESRRQTRGGLAQAVSVIGERLNTLRGEADKLVSKRETQFVLGKVSGRAVYDGQKRIIIAAGEVISEEHINQAVEADRLHQLALAAGINNVKKSWSGWTRPKTPGDSEIDDRSLEK